MKWHAHKNPFYILSRLFCSTLKSQSRTTIPKDQLKPIHSDTKPAMPEALLPSHYNNRPAAKPTRAAHTPRQKKTAAIPLSSKNREQTKKKTPNLRRRLPNHQTGRSSRRSHADDDANVGGRGGRGGGSLPQGRPDEEAPGPGGGGRGSQVRDVKVAREPLRQRVTLVPWLARRRADPASADQHQLHQRHDEVGRGTG